MSNLKKVLLISPPFIPTSRDAVGGAEQMTYNLGRALVEQGHDVHTLARDDSRVEGTLVPLGLKHTGGKEKETSQLSTYRQLTSLVTANYGKFLRENPDTDVVVDSYSCIGLMRELAEGYGPQVLTRLNLVPKDFLLPEVFEDIKYHLNRNSSESMLVPISTSMLEDYTSAFDFSDYNKPLPIVRNSVIAENFSYNAQPENYVLFLGRIEEEKGTHLALKAAKETGNRIIVAGGTSNGHAKDIFLNGNYYHNKVEPLIDGSVEMFGPANLEQKVDLMRNAKAVLTPIQWNEPGGLVQLEAMACGTPVVSYNRGGPAETIIHGKTGFLVDNYASFVDCLNNIETISRKDCREHIEQNFDYKVMGQNYARLFK